MRRALRLAVRGHGWTNPNPMVGAVLVRDGRIIGEGYHTAVGNPHAEREALADCRRRGENPAGATLYVNLEPCNHQGRTPPCTEAIIESRLARVIIAHQDPNPLVNGSGIRRLESAGIPVESGVLAKEAIALNEGYCRYICAGRPFVTLKAATTLDGRIATASGHSQWVSGPAALRFAHWLRHVNDAILVGVDTVIADDPQLTCRLPDFFPHRQPLRVILDSRLRIPPAAKVVSGKLPGQTLVAVTDRAPREKIDRLAKPGVIVDIFPADADGRVDIAAVLQALHRRQIAALLVEGGGHVHASFLQLRLADKLNLVLAPKLVGGRDAKSWIAGELAATMDQALRLKDFHTRRLGVDLLVESHLEEVGECLLV
ncbi:MAG: bifunctional diaminohydroxyphosphoribosylaminopyrimidine deaminase/5-amino-6-(5-phosphoribosylamino)uracil reductase RibD [Myxococcales bacterium]|nr:bifunctional diaminohydroxyphosphoribosylaminopyrimidine deaminase/5-amino-6-(5-phosphoribosylamino)uracil reductase RibD [Myxococcales bacterium]